MVRKVDGPSGLSEWIVSGIVVAGAIGIALTSIHLVIRVMAGGLALLSIGVRILVHRRNRRGQRRSDE
jgi:hypothetical protein